MSETSGRREVPALIGERLSLAEQMREIDEAILAYRQDLVDAMPQLGDSFTYTYGRGHVEARNSALSGRFETRKAFFMSLAEQFPERARVLNIGSGGDVAPILSFLDSNREVISTDKLCSVISMLRACLREHAAFPCDLVDLSNIMGENSVDAIIGNSVLAYVEPRKLLAVVDNLVRVMRQGAVFTFDLTPNPAYAAILSPEEEQSIINEMEPNPADLLMLIERFGAEQALHLFGIYSSMKFCALQAAILFVLKGAFERHGLRCRVGVYDEKRRFTILRVSKTNDDFLLPLDEELPFDFEAEDWLSQFGSYARPDDRMPYLDQMWAARINPRLNHPFGTMALRNLVHDRGHPLRANEAHVAQLMRELSPVGNIVDLFQPFLEGEVVTPPKPLSDIRLEEQRRLHNILRRGGSLSELSQLTADINTLYQEQRTAGNLKDEDDPRKVYARLMN